MGIIAGIGDKIQGKNLITPEIDAKVYNYILGKEAIIDGLTISNNELTKGTCILCGYRGVNTEIKPLNTSVDKYIYGKFTLHFSDVLDEFDIETSETPKPTNVNPITIDTAGTYYLLLYVYIDGAYVKYFDLDTNDYPAKAYESDEATDLISGGTIASNVTGTTQNVNDNSTKVATTEYVHNQIEEEIDANEYTGNFVAKNGAIIGTYTLKRKAKFVIGVANVISGNIGNMTGIWTTFPQGFKPKSAFYFGIYSRIINITSNSIMYCNTNGEVTMAIDSGEIGDYNYSTTFGYEIN